MRCERDASKRRTREVRLPPPHHPSAIPELTRHRSATQGLIGRAQRLRAELAEAVAVSPNTDVPVID